MADFGETVGNARKEANTFQDDATGTGDVVGLGSQFVFDITPEHRTTVLSENDLNGSTLFWDDDNQGEWDTNYWSGDNDLDGYLSKEWVRVVSLNNSFEDNFETNTFIDETNSTGTGDHTTDYDYTLATGEQLQSKIIARTGQALSRAIITLTGTNVNLVNIFLSNDGSTWELASNAVSHSFTLSDTEGIRYKITTPGGTSFPMTFPFTFLGGTTITITKIEVKYS